MDPPWQLSSSNPSRGVAIAYNSLADEIISNIPVNTLQKEGFCFIWVINAKYRFSVKLMESWGYNLVDEITWVTYSLISNLFCRSRKLLMAKSPKDMDFIYNMRKKAAWLALKGNLNIIKIYAVTLYLVLEEVRVRNLKKYTNI